MIKIIQLNHIDNNNTFDQLVHLLFDCVDSGSIGFISPLHTSDALSYWNSVKSDLLTSRDRILLVATEEIVSDESNNETINTLSESIDRNDSFKIVGSVQISLCCKKNGLHRAEIEKLMVLCSHRNKGIGKSLMEKAETIAKEHNRSLLVLDTREGDVASRLYKKLGFTEVGSIPQYALSSNGILEGTTIFYKLI